MEPTQRSALARLLNGLKREQHDYRPSLEVFPALNIEKLAGDMGLATAGAERGTREEPGSDSVAFDDVENRIIERVEAEKNAAQGLLLDELRIREVDVGRTTRACPRGAGRSALRLGFRPRCAEPGFPPTARTKRGIGENRGEENCSGNGRRHPGISPVKSHG